MQPPACCPTALWRMTSGECRGPMLGMGTGRLSIGAENHQDTLNNLGERPLPRGQEHLDYPMHYRHRQVQHLFPDSWVSRRRKAITSSTSVIWRYQPGQVRTSYSSRPPSVLACS